VNDPFVLGSYIGTYGLVAVYGISLAVRIRRAKRGG
jgi:hypothetical protein